MAAAGETFPLCTDSRIFSSSAWFMKFGRSRFYHWCARMPRLDLTQSGWETQFSREKTSKQRKELTQRSQRTQSARRNKQKPHTHGAGDDQVRALGVCAAVCADGGVAGGAGD